MGKIEIDYDEIEEAEILIRELGHEMGYSSIFLAVALRVVADKLEKEEGFTCTQIWDSSEEKKLH